MADKNYNIPKIWEANLLFLITASLFIGVDLGLKGFDTSGFTYYQKLAVVTLAQILFVFLPVLVFVKLFRWDYKKTFRVNKVSFVNWLLAGFLMLFAIPIVSFINLFVILVLRYFGKAMPAPNFPVENLPQLLFTLLVVAGTPAIFEEILVRGAIYKAYERYGYIISIIMSSLLFGLLHRNLQSLLGTFLLGCLIAYIAYKTNSIFPGMVAHFTNNGAVVILTYIIYKVQRFFLESDKVPKALKDQILMPKDINAIPMDLLLKTFLAYGIISLIFLGVFAGILILFNYTTRNIEREREKLEEPRKISEFVPLILGVILIAIVYAVQLS